MEIANPKKVKFIKKVSSVCSIFYHTKKINDKIPFNTARRVLIFDPMLIGDTIMIIPFLKTVRENFKNAEITLLCGKHAPIILKETNLVDNYITFNGCKSFNTISDVIKDLSHLRETLKKINKVKYDVAIEPRGDFRYLYYMHYIKAKRKISFDYSGGECFLTDVVPMPANYKETHLTDDKLYLMERIGAKVNKSVTTNLPITKEMKKMREEFVKENKLEGYKLIGIHPGAREQIRRYEKFDEVVKEIYKKDKKIAFLVYEGIDEVDAVEKVLKACDEIGAKSFRMKSSLEDYLKKITFIDAMICNDSSAGHIANAYKIPTTVIYGPVNPGGIKPYNNTTAILNCVSIPLKCKPCYCAECPNGMYECFNSINTEKVANLVINSTKKQVNYDR